jgi:ribosomal protein L32E
LFEKRRAYLYGSRRLEAKVIEEEKLEKMRACVKLKGESMKEKAGSEQDRHVQKAGRMQPRWRKTKSGEAKQRREREGVV